MFGWSKQRQAMGLFKNLVACAAADGNISRDEAKILAAMGTHLGLSTKAIENVVTRPEKIMVRLPKDEKGKLKHLLMCVQVMATDGKIHSREHSFCQMIAAKMGLPPALVDKMVVDFLAHVARAIGERVKRSSSVPSRGGLEAQIDEFLEVHGRA